MRACSTTDAVFHERFCRHHLLPIVFAVLLCTTCDICVFAAAVSKEDVALAQARQYAANLQFAEAEKLCDTWLKKTKQKDVWLEAKTMNRYYRGKSPVELALSACKANPKNSRSLATFALVLYSHRKFQAAIDMARQALELDAKNGRAYAASGASYAAMNKKELAEQAFDKAVQYSPQDLDVNVLALKFYSQSGDSELFHSASQRLTKYNPRSAYAFCTRGVYARRQYKGTATLADFEKATQLNPNDAMSVQYYAKLLRERQRFAEAAKQFEKYFVLTKDESALSASPNHFRLGDCYRHMKMYDKAIEEHTKALAPLVPGGEKSFQSDWRKLPEKSRIDYKTYWLRRVELYDLAGQTEKALVDVNQMLKCEPDDSSAVYTRYNLYLKTAQYKLALNDLNYLIEQHKDISKYYALRAELMDVLGKPAEAEKDRKRAAHIQLYGTPE